MTKLWLFGLLHDTTSQESSKSAGSNLRAPWTSVQNVTAVRFQSGLSTVWNIDQVSGCEKVSALKLHFYWWPTVGKLLWIQKEVWCLKYVSLWKTNPTFYLHHYISGQFPNDCMVSIASSKSSSMQRGVHFVNKGPIESKMDITAGCRYHGVSHPIRISSPLTLDSCRPTD